jgi:hypothetical protein
VGVQHVAVGEVHEQVLARRLDRGDLGSGFRSAPAAGIPSHLEFHDLLSDQGRPQPGGYSKDRVALGHDALRGG